MTTGQKIADMEVPPKPIDNLKQVAENFSEGNRKMEADAEKLGLKQEISREGKPDEVAQTPDVESKGLTVREMKDEVKQEVGVEIAELAAKVAKLDEKLDAFIADLKQFKRAMGR